MRGDKKTLLGLMAFASCLVALSGQRPDAGSSPETIDALPMQRLSLETLDGFRSPGGNWRIAGEVRSDFRAGGSVEIEPGTGVLVNLPGEGRGNQLFSHLEHGDIELKVEFLVPKGSRSGISFQGRYEVQIRDSWGVTEPSFSDLGGIDAGGEGWKAEGDGLYEGRAPRVNAGKAPGLWQELHVLFRAPRFDEGFEKIHSARFEWIDLNGTRIHGDVELAGPTRGAAFEGEVESAPLMLRGDAGPVAFRNLRYKTFSRTHSLTLGEMHYKIYDYYGHHTPDWDAFHALPVIKEGFTDSFDVARLSPKAEHYAMTFSGDLRVPVTGDYLFQTQMANGGNLYINGEPVVENRGDLDPPRLGRIVHLQKGTHRLDLSFFQVIWRAQIVLFYEGPQMERRTLASTAPGSQSRPPPPLTLAPASEEVERIGGFVTYGNEKRTHVLSVRHPEGIHYSYDLNRAALLKFWRDPFADVTEMWRGRGSEQLLVPLNAAVEASAGVPVARTGTGPVFSNQRVPDELRAKDYVINEAGRPLFRFDYGGVSIEDDLRPSKATGGLVRRLRFEAERPPDDLVGRIAQGERIELLSNEWFRIDGRYYVRIDGPGAKEAVIQEGEGVKALFIPILRGTRRSEIQYQLLW